MLDTLKILNRATAKQGIFAHLCIDDGYAEANNGRISIRAAIPELKGITATVAADKFISAVKACKGAMEIKTTESSLLVKSGAFSARIALNKADFPRMTYSEGTPVALPPDFVEKLAIAQAFATSEAFNGILLRGKRIYSIRQEGAVAIDGIDVANDVVLPIDTVSDIVSIREAPVDMATTGTHAVLVYQNFWLRTQVIDKKWPDAESVLSFDHDALSHVSQELREALDTVMPFVDREKRVTFTGEAIKGGEATVNGITLPRSSFNGEYLTTALKYADSINITTVQGNHAGVQFTGKDLVGTMVGLVTKEDAQ